MTLEPVTSPKNVLNKLKMTKEALNSLSSHTRMFVCTKLQLHLIRWLRLNFTSGRLIPTARHCFRLQTKLPSRIQTLQAPDTGTEMSQWEKILSARWWKAFLLKQSYRSGTRITAFVHRLSLLCSSAVWTQGKSVQSQSTKMNGAFPTTSARQQVHKKEIVQRFYVTRFSHNSLFSKKHQEWQGKMSPARQPVLAQTKPTVSSPKPIYFLGTAAPKLHPTYSAWNNEHLSRKVWRTVAIKATKSCNLFNEFSKDSLSPLPVNGKTIIFKIETVFLRRNMSIISIVDKSRSLLIVVDSNQSTNIGSR